MSTGQQQASREARPEPRRGRSVLGALSGLALGVFLAVDLQQLGLHPLDNVTVFALPLLGLAAGLALGRWTPLSGRRRRG